MLASIDWASQQEFSTITNDNLGVDMVPPQILYSVELAHASLITAQESDDAPPDPAPNEDAQSLLALLSLCKKLSCHDKGHVISLPVISKNAPTNKRQHTAKHTIILDGMNSMWAMHCTKRKVLDYSSIKTGTLVGCGATDGDTGFGVVQLKTGERLAVVSQWSS